MKSLRKTALIVVLGAALGLGAVGWYDRTMLSPAGAAGNGGAAGSRGATGPTTAAALPTAGRSISTRAGSGRYADGSYTGRSIYAYYGYVQVRAVISGGRLQRVLFLQVPDHSGTSRYINSIAGPYLETEAVSAQSSRVDLISGATLTSQAFVESLGTALSQAN